MLDTIQIVLIIVISVLTVLLTLIGIQIYYILKELRKSADKLNNILDDAKVITGSTAKGISNLSTALDIINSRVGAFSKGLAFFNFLRRKNV